ncbi:MAG: hypothetical protein S4CHLAM6_07670 [Chlamydiae bacterium]|nr:hypothetical protein [Chlamydiota bacterium]
MKQKVALKILVGVLAIGAIVSTAYFGELRFKPNNRCKCVSQFQNDKIRKIFSYLRNNDVSFEECLLKSGALCEAEMNEAYHKAVDLGEYDLAIKLYSLGATDCYQKNKDILLVCLNAGRFDLIGQLVKPDYPIDASHINAAKSLINVSQPNWAFIYQKNDTDRVGFSDYQEKSKDVIMRIIDIYRQQHPVKKIDFLSQSEHEKSYASIFGKEAQKDFQEALNKAIKKGYSFDVAKHGSQKRVIILDKHGKSLGIIKSKNELLAYAFDLDHFAKVPPVAEVFIPEYGQVIVQKWVANTKMVRDHQIKSEESSQQANLIEQLHHIRMLDIRLGNSDRNNGNLLITKQNDQCNIIPIDHDLLMFYIPNDLDWEAPYLNLPFSKITQSHISKIDLEKDALTMKKFSCSDEEIKSMKLRTTLLKMAVANHLELREVDMLFRFYYYDFLDQVRNLSAESSEEQYQQILFPHFKQSIAVIQQPTEVWRLIGNSFEFYI